ncbi:MAG: phosphatase PAP2 family protein [Rhodospirillaceae bacterium]|nr:phosphatase PAP2 family protein [Rhodospirillaceae bacterium]
MIDRVWAALSSNPYRSVLALLLFFMFFPGFDIWVSGQYYDPGVGFSWDREGFLEFVRSVVPGLIIASFIVCLVLWVAGIWYERWFWGITTHRAVYLMVSLLVGPGLLVESLLKPNWGRARPKDLTLFGGTADYTPPFWIASECERNCSFVSGHAAIAFWVTAYGLMLPAKWRVLGVGLGVAFGLIMGWVRIIQGGHFLSDVVFAGVIVIGVNVYLYRRIILAEGTADDLT